MSGFFMVYCFYNMKDLYMRITGGELGGRKLSTPKGGDIRPTTDKVRLALFNMLNSRGLVCDAYVMDAFCGTGSLGIEALSHGAKHVYFIDKDVRAINLTKENADILDLNDSCSFFKRDVIKGFTESDAMNKFDLVFLDPPYHKNLIIPAINSLIDKNCLSENCHIIAETEKTVDLCKELEDVKSETELIVEKIYGSIKISIIRVV